MTAIFKIVLYKAGYGLLRLFPTVSGKLKQVLAACKDLVAGPVGVILVKALRADKLRGKAPVRLLIQIKAPRRSALSRPAGEHPVQPSEKRVPHGLLMDEQHSYRVRPAVA